MKFRAEICLKNPQPYLEKFGLQTTAHLFTLAEARSGPSHDGLAFRRMVRRSRLGSPHILPGDLAMRSTPRGSVAKSGYLVTCLRDLPRGVEA